MTTISRLATPRHKQAGVYDFGKRWGAGECGCRYCGPREDDTVLIIPTLKISESSKIQIEFIGKPEIGIGKVMKDKVSLFT